jgi:hypothetical protein
MLLDVVSRSGPHIAIATRRVSLTLQAPSA